MHADWLIPARPARVVTAGKADRRAFDGGQGSDEKIFEAFLE
jgi:hypothetical protein